MFATPNIVIGLAVLALAAIFLPKLIANWLKYLESLQGKVASEGGEVDLASQIKQKISEVSDYSPDSERAAKAIAQIVDREVSHQVEVLTKEIDEKYKKAFEEKDVRYKAVEEKLIKTVTEKKQTESVIRSIAEGLVVLNDKGEVVMMNPAAEKLLAVEREKQLGRPIKETNKDEQLISLVRENGDTGEREIEYNSQSEDTKKVLRSSTAVIENENGQTIGMVSVLTDVTKQRELDRMKASFVSSVSHELRTPIVAIRNSIAIMTNKAAGPLTSDQEKFMNIAERNLKRLSDLIDDLLDLSRLEAKRMEIRLEAGSIEKLIQETIDSFAAWSKTKEIALKQKITGDIPLVPFDHKRITQVLTNLVGNSLKFTPKGGSITIAAGISSNGKDLIVSVEDTGIGIAKEDIDKLFNKFVQVGGKSTAEISGTGLGLAISKELIILHQGHIWVDSQLGKGSKFTFTIPVAQE